MSKKFDEIIVERVESNLPENLLSETLKILNKKDGMLCDIPWVESDLGIDACCILEANSEVDKALLASSNDSAALRLQENLGLAEGFRQTAAKYLFYGDTNAYPEQFNGLAVRFNSLNGTAKNQIVDANPYKTFKFIPDKVSKYVQQLFEKKNKFSSAWLINWDEDIVHGIYPSKKTNAGLNISDKGEQRVLDVNGAPFYAYCTNLQWIFGLIVENLRGVARVCNIDSNIDKYNNKDIDKLIRNMMQAQCAIPDNLIKNPKWYVSPEIYFLLQQRLMKNIFISKEEKLNEKPKLYLNGILVKKIDELKNDENRIN